MKYSIPATLAALSTLTLSSLAYSLTDTIIGNDFFKAFEWQAIGDPTYGRVNYVDQATARAQNLTYAHGDTFILRTDFKTKLGPVPGPGRNSVRIRSKKTYSNHVAVFDVRHMPQGCGTWPAIWETNERDWPRGGEVDILEGVNDFGTNAVTLHTTDGCTMAAQRPHTGSPTQLDCNWEINGNTGCPVKDPRPNSYGPNFNRNGGGYLAMERSPGFIKAWFWERNAVDIPDSVRNGLPNANPDLWGIPMAYFPDTTCPINSLFNDHNIIINLTLCGDWAGSVFGQSGCPGDCNAYVEENPAAFEQAYFDIASIRVYQ